MRSCASTDLGSGLCAPEKLALEPCRNAYPLTVFDPIYDCLLGEIGLITKIVLNKLDQPLVYEITISENVYYCKSILADKYLRKV